MLCVKRCRSIDAKSWIQSKSKENTLKTLIHIKLEKIGLLSVFTYATHGCVRDQTLWSSKNQLNTLK